MSKSKIQIIPFMLILTLITASILLFEITTVNAATVLDVPSARYPTIQSALSAAKDGDTIKIASGTINGNINYDGYALTVSDGLSQPKTGITLQGSTGTIINGAVKLLYLKQFKIIDLTVTGDLTLGNGGAYDYVTGSLVSNVQVGAILTVGGQDNTVSVCKIQMLLLKGGNTKTEFPAVNTIVENNQLRGLTIQAGSHQNIIKTNIITHGQIGVSEVPSKTYYTTGGNQFINNTIANCEVGLGLYCSTGDNGAASHSADQFIQNIIRDNTVGLSLSASDQYVIGNTYYHNDFLNNNEHVKISNPVANMWDDGAKKGNYWSTYTGTDANGDGVGDTPHKIDAQNQDNYPLMKPYSAPASSQATSQPNSASSTPSQSPLSVAPEFTPMLAVVGLMAVSLVLLVFFKRKVAVSF
jgi:hypothetical protein